MIEHTPTPWAYRPKEYDDWGFIRGPDGGVACIARGETSETHDAHRAAGTDPYGPNALLIVKAVNNHDALVKALLRAREAVNAIVLSTHSISFDADLRAIDLALEGCGVPVSAPGGGK